MRRGALAEDVVNLAAETIKGMRLATQLVERPLEEVAGCKIPGKEECLELVPGLGNNVGGQMLQLFQTEGEACARWGAFLFAAFARGLLLSVEPLLDHRVQMMVEPMG